MRSGAPDALDLMVAVNFANMAMDLIAQDAGPHGCAAAGHYTTVPIEAMMQGTKRVDVERSTTRSIPAAHPQGPGKPMFLLLIPMGASGQE